MWVWRGLLLQDLDSISPLRYIEMVNNSASRTGKTWVPQRREIALDIGLGGDDLVYLLGVLVLAHRDSVLVNLQLCYIFLLARRFNGACRHLHSAVQERCFPHQPLPVGCSLTCTVLVERLLKHP